MADDWRATIDLAEASGPARLLDRLRELGLADEVYARFGSRVVVSRSGARVFLYAGSDADLGEAVEATRTVLRDHELHGTVATARWHPLEERWEDPSVPLPETAEDRARELAALRAREEADSTRRGEPEWEVRVELADRRAARAAEATLAADHIPVVRRFSYLIAGATSNEAAHALADRLRAELPAGTQITVEGSPTVAREQLRNPFAIFGGLGG